MSIEADLIFPDDPGRRKADDVEGSIGELSDFHRLHLVYAQTIGFETVMLPDGWAERVEMFERPDTGIARARCREPHDLVVAKLVAGRPKDLSFASALVRAGLVSVETLRERARALPSAVDREAVATRVVVGRSLERGCDSETAGCCKESGETSPPRPPTSQRIERSSLRPGAARGRA